MYLFKICLFFLCLLNDRKVYAEPLLWSILAKLGPSKNKKKYNFGGLMKCATVLCLLIYPQEVWCNWIISQNFIVNGRADYSSVQTKLENFLISWLNLVGLLILWLWQVWCAITSVFASCEFSMRMKLVADEKVNFIVIFVPIAVFNLSTWHKEYLA